MCGTLNAKNLQVILSKKKITTEKQQQQQINIDRERLNAKQQKKMHKHNP